MSGSRSDKRVDQDRLVGHDEPMKKRSSSAATRILVLKIGFMVLQDGMC